MSKEISNELYAALRKLYGYCYIEAAEDWCDISYSLIPVFEAAEKDSKFVVPVKCNDCDRGWAIINGKTQSGKECQTCKGYEWV